MNVLDLFSGLGGWSTPFAERGHEVVTVDIEERFGCTYTADVLKWEPEGEFDIVLASPPCEKFSILAIGKAWLPGYVPQHDGTRLAIRLVERTVELIDQIRPRFWVVENPVGMLRKLDLLPYERRWVTYCRYGAPFRKPTDLWGGFPPSLHLRSVCSNGSPCHIASPRGSRHGIQSDTSNKHPRVLEWNRILLAQPSAMGTSGHVNVSKAFGGGDRAALRAVIPPELALDVCIAAERDFAAGLRAADYTGRLFA